MNIDHLNFIVLFGKTGCGKSEILTHLQKLGEQVLHLESTALHRGSAFGWLKGISQPTQKQFEEKLNNQLISFDPTQPIWVEFESSYLGNLRIPENLFEQWQQSKMFVIDINRNERIQRIVNDYHKLETEELLNSAQKIKKKISPKKYRFIRKKIKEEDFAKATSAIITYYDQIYENALSKRSSLVIANLHLSGDNSDENAEIILNHYNTL